MKDQVCLVTGANAGIGRATARGLAERGATVVMVCRSEERGRAARDEIRQATGHDAVDLLLADLASQAQIHRLAETFTARYDRLDVLVNNAGVYLAEREVTEDGFEKTFAVNHLAYFLLTNLLLDVLKASAPARIVNVSSGAHRNATIDFDDLNAEQDYSGLQAYAQSKLANVLFTQALARRLEGTGVTANALHPGVVATSIWDRNADWLSRVARLFKRFYRSPERGAETVLYLATSPEVEGVTGQYFKDRQEAPSSAASRDPELAERLWRVSEEMTGRIVDRES